MAPDERGVAALEFALVATPFLLLMFAVFEYVLVYLVSASLDGAVIETARLIRTGEAQQAGMTSSQFQAQVCSRMGWLTTSCASNLYVDARTFSSFAGDSSPQPVSNGQFDKTQLSFNMGAPGQIVLVTCYYQWGLLTPALPGLASMTGGIDVITSRTAFRNEPYA